MKKSWKNPALYKTRLCDNWMLEKPCRYGVKCWYAHGPHELRNVPRLEDNPSAKAQSLAEVLEILPQTHINPNSVHRITEQKSNADLNVFRMITVPALNAMVANMFVEERSDLSAQLMSLLLKLNNGASQDQSNEGISETQPHQDFLGFKSLSRVQSSASQNFSTSGHSSTHQQNGRISTSPRSGSISPTYSPSNMPDQSFDEEDAGFELIRQRLEGDCDNFFT